MLRLLITILLVSFVGCKQRREASELAQLGGAGGVKDHTHSKARGEKYRESAAGRASKLFQAIEKPLCDRRGSQTAWAKAFPMETSYTVDQFVKKVSPIPFSSKNRDGSQKFLTRDNPMHVEILLPKNIDEATLKSIKAVISPMIKAFYPFVYEVRILPQRLEDTFDFKNAKAGGNDKVDASKILEKMGTLFRRSIVEAKVVIVDVPMNAPKYNLNNFVFGLASEKHRASVISLWELKQNKLAGLSFQKALLTIVLHELGHNFDFHHSNQCLSLMNGYMNAEDLVNAPLFLGPQELAKLAFHLPNNFGYFGGYIKPGSSLIRRFIKLKEWATTLEEDAKTDASMQKFWKKQSQYWDSAQKQVEKFVATL